MSGSNWKKWALVAAAILVVVLTAAASGLALTEPGCKQLMFADMARGLAAGGLLALVKTTDRLVRSKRACHPLWCWVCFAYTVGRSELKYGLVGGHLLGLILAMHHYATC